MLLWMLVTGCTIPVVACESHADCASAFGVGWECGDDGYCALSTTSTGTDTEPTGTDTTGTDTGKHDPILLIINEVLYDPSNEKPGTDGVLPGDANGDGVYVHDDDEFVELVNISGGTADVSGYRLFDEEAWGTQEPRHRVPAGTYLDPGGALVVFGGGVPKGKFGGAEVQVASGGSINLNNASDTLRITNASGDVVATFDVTVRSDDPDESYTRNPDITGTFEQHGRSSKRLFSPGTRTDGTPFR